MHSTKRRILVIENQLTQFDKIALKLGEYYEVFPKMEDYEKFMDWIRVVINKRYQPERISKFFSNISEYLISCDIELAIVDFKLSGCHDGLTGIELALQLDGISGFRGKPYMFLSRTPPNAKEVKQNISLVKNAEWVEKGYAGLSLMEENYFKTYVIDRIPVLLQRSANDNINARASEIFPLKIFDPYREKCNGLLNKETYTGDEASFIREFKDPGTLTDTEIAELFNKYKHIW